MFLLISSALVHCPQIAIKQSVQAKQTHCSLKHPQYVPHDRQQPVAAGFDAAAACRCLQSIWPPAASAAGSAAAAAACAVAKSAAEEQPQQASGIVAGVPHSFFLLHLRSHSSSVANGWLSGSPVHLHFMLLVYLGPTVSAHSLRKDTHAADKLLLLLPAPRCVALLHPSVLTPVPSCVMLHARVAGCCRPCKPGAGPL